MKVIILAAGQGTRLRPFTDDRPKCMVKVNGRSIIDRQLDSMKLCGIKNEDITIISGYRSDSLMEKFRNTGMNIIFNENFETTNMVCSLMCARPLMESQDDILVSYGDIIYEKEVLQKILASEEDISVIVDDGWYSYWAERCENPLDDAETLMVDGNGYLTEIGQKTDDLRRVQAQYIGLMRFRGKGLWAMLDLACEAERRTKEGTSLWRTSRSYQKMYMTDLLQGLIDEGNKLKAVHINRGWFEIDDCDDLKVVEGKLKAPKGRLYWITGLSGAGKTTIGTLFYNTLKTRKPETVFLDGDTLRQVFGNDLGYSREDRLACAMRYSRLCGLLTKQGMDVVCCTISMFDEVRAWNRENIENYTEIYVSAPMEVLEERNQKGLYTGVKNKTTANVTGLDIEPELPKDPDIVLMNDGKKTPKEMAKELIMAAEANA